MVLATCFLINSNTFAFDKDASSTLSHYIMGVMHEGMGDLDSAIEEYKQALDKDYESAIIHLNLAANYIKKDKLDQAVEELNLSAKFDPDAVEPHAILAILYSSQNKLDKSAEEYELALKKASKLEPGNVEIYKNLGVLYLQQKRAEEAQKIYKLIVDLSPDDPEARFYLASVYNNLGKDDLAEQELKKALELNPQYHQALNFLGYLYVEENRDLDRAGEMIDKALEMQPDNGAYIDSLGWFYFKKGKFQEAKDKLEQASTLLEDPVIYDHLGDVYQKLNDVENAKLNWRKSLELDPNQDKIKEKIEKW